MITELSDLAHYEITHLMSSMQSFSISDYTYHLQSYPFAQQLITYANRLNKLTAQSTFLNQQVQLNTVPINTINYLKKLKGFAGLYESLNCPLFLIDLLDMQAVTYTGRFLKN